MTTDRPNNRTNYHSHCSFCDGKAPMEDFVEEAVRQGFAAYGISSHAPLPFPARWTLEAERMAAYLAEIDRLKAAYADRIELYAGLEIDYLNEQSNPASDYFQKLPLDYRIGSVHLIESRGKYVDIDTDAETFAENLRLHFGDDLRKLVTDYFDKLMRMVSEDSTSWDMPTRSSTMPPDASPTLRNSHGTGRKSGNISKRSRGTAQWSKSTRKNTMPAPAAYFSRTDRTSGCCGSCAFPCSSIRTPTCPKRSTAAAGKRSLHCKKPASIRSCN